MQVDDLTSFPFCHLPKDILFVILGIAYPCDWSVMLDWKREDEGLAEAKKAELERRRKAIRKKITKQEKKVGGERGRGKKRGGGRVRDWRNEEPAETAADIEARNNRGGRGDRGRGQGRGRGRGRAIWVPVTDSSSQDSQNETETQKNGHSPTPVPKKKFLTLEERFREVNQEIKAKSWEPCARRKRAMVELQKIEDWVFALGGKETFEAIISVYIHSLTEL